MIELHTISWMSKKPEEFHKLSDEIHEIVANSKIKNGIVIILTAHTTTGIMVNEGLPCVEKDIMDTLTRLVPEDNNYMHAHFLPSYGATGNNSTGHIRSMLCGNHCVFPLKDGEMIRGGAQDIYIVEFDGPQTRKIYVEIMGE